MDIKKKLTDTLMTQLAMLDPKINEQVLKTATYIEQNGRDAYLMELDPRYVDVIIKRWEEFTGQKAVKISK